MAPKSDAAVALKRKADATDSPAPKKAGKAQKAEEKKAEVETDAAPDDRPGIAEVVGFDTKDTTLNVIPSLGGRMLMMLSEGGMQYLVAGARANVGVKAGRYMFEVRMIEQLTADTKHSTARGSTSAKQIVRLGFSTGSCSLISGEGEPCVGFDSDGFFFSSDKKKEAVGPRFGKDNVMAVVLNLDPKSENVNTISIFKDGIRVCEPKAVPEELRGQPLFPHVSFRNASLQLHFGLEPLVPLPFKCRSLQSAAQDDVILQPSSAPKDGKYEVVFPVAVPDEGTFTWLDQFMQENPHFVELSDRKILEWLSKSGVWKPGVTSKSNTCNDKPEFNFGIPNLDDLSPQAVLRIAAPLVPRNYLVMEVKENLLKTARMDALRRFRSTNYKRIAKVVVGSPDAKWQEKRFSKLLKVKQAKLDAEWKVKKVERDKKKQVVQRQKYLAEVRKAAEEKKKKAAEEKAAAVEAAKKVVAEKAAKKKAEKEAAAKQEAGEDGKDGTDDTKEKGDAEKKEDKEAAKEDGQSKEGAEAKNEDEPEEEEPEPPVAELSEAEMKDMFPKKEYSDLLPNVLSGAFAQFTVPGEDEGFSEIQYLWDGADAAKEYLGRWVAQRKITLRVEDLEPSEWFKENLANWQKSLQGWQLKQKDFKLDPVKMKAAQKRQERALAKKDAESKEGDSAEKKDGDDAAEKKDGSDDAAKKEGESFDPEAAPAEEAEDGEAIGEIDVSTVADVCDMGNGEPIFLYFAFEDWALISLRFELHLLANAYLHDTEDPERLGIHESNLAFYYNKYYRKTLNTKFYGADTIKSLLDIVADTVAIHSETGVMITQLAEGDNSDNLDVFVKVTEAARRERQRRLDAGDESARLKINVLTSSTPAPKATSGIRDSTAKTPGAVPAKAKWNSSQERSEDDGKGWKGGKGKGKGKGKKGGGYRNQW